MIILVNKIQYRKNHQLMTQITVHLTTADAPKCLP